MRERFQSKDRRFIAVCVVVALICGLFAWRYFERAFPEASIQFEVDREQSRNLAVTFLEDLGYDTSGYQHAAVFDYDQETKTFLERELGPARAQDVYGRPVKLWRWRHRWFKPKQKEELRVDVTERGEIAGFERLLSEEAGVARLASETARRLAEAFLVDRMHADLEGHEFVEGSSTELPNRTDHDFTWKRRDFEIEGASYRSRVTISGDQVTAFEENLRIPDVWLDEYQRLRARNETAALVASVLLALTVVAMIAVFALRIRDRDVRWRTVFAFGSLAFLLQLLSSLNQFGIQKFQYETQDSYASFITQFLLGSVLTSVALGGFILLLTAAGEPTYRERYRSKLSLTALFTRRGMRTKSFFKQVVLGLTLTVCFAAYQTLFYLVAARFGAWAPLEVPYSNMLNTAIPWAIVLFTGFFPAVSEEFISRMFSIPFLQKHFEKLRWNGSIAMVAAVVISSFIWGFAHSNYPNQPFYIRGLEVGIAGLVMSVVMLRWGILAALIWHYTVDAFYTSLLMLRSGDTYFVVSGCITAGLMLMPLLATLVLYKRHGGFESEDGLRNADEPTAEPPSREALPLQPPISYDRVPRGRIVAGAALAVGLLLLYLVPAKQPGEDLMVRSGRTDAMQTARDHLAGKGEDPKRFRVAAQMVSRYDPAVGRYVLEHRSLGRLNELYKDRMRSPVWRVRFFRPEEREEYVFNLPVDDVAPPGLWAFEHIVPDSSAGDHLNADTAKSLVADFLLEQGFDPSGFEVKESRSEIKKARVDHMFEWEVPDTTLGDAAVRYVVKVQGDEVAGLRPYVHLPESWLRDYDERTVLRWILWVATRALVGVSVLLIAMLFVGKLRSRQFPWSVGMRWGAFVGATVLVLFALRWQSDILMRYETTIPWRLYLIAASAGVVVQVVLLSLLAMVIAGTAIGVRPRLQGLFAGGHEKGFVRDAVILTVVGLGIGLGLQRLFVVLQDLGSSHALVNELLLFEAVGRTLPWLDTYLSFLRVGVLMLGTLAILAHLARHRFGFHKAAWVLGTALVLFAAESSRSWPQFALQLAIHVSFAGVLVFMVTRLFRGNELAYLMLYVAGIGLGSAVQWIRQPAQAVRESGLVLAGLVVATLILMAWAAGRGRSRHEPSSDEPVIPRAPSPGP